MFEKRSIFDEVRNDVDKTAVCDYLFKVDAKELGEILKIFITPEFVGEYLSKIPDEDFEKVSDAVVSRQKFTEQTFNRYLKNLSREQLKVVIQKYIWLFDDTEFSTDDVF